MRSKAVNVIVLIGLAFIGVMITVSGQNISETEIAVAASSPAPSLSTTRRPFLPSFRLPCSCLAGQCGCCTGYVLDRLNQKACMNMTYEPEDFAIRAVMSLNGVPFYENTVSGKNPPPICIRVPRLRFIKFCMEFSNIYFAERNVHLCLDAKANWENFTLLEWSFDCIRMGASGFQTIRPEDGSGISEKPIDSESQTDQDYDDSARNNPIPENKNPRIIFDKSVKMLSKKAQGNDIVSVRKTRTGNFVIRAK